MVIKKDINRNDYIVEIASKFSNGKAVEVGVFKGKFSKHILSNWDGTLYMVDVWRPLGQEYLDASNHAEHVTAYFDTMNNISGFEDRGIMVRADSKIASNMFDNESLDFIYIDANHAYDYVKKDIEFWYPKLKWGGFLLGHDYINLDWYNDPNFLPNGKDKHIWNGNFYHGVFGVNPAVDEFCEDYAFELTVTSEWFGTWCIKKA
jgi:hypothetical protein